MGYAKLEQTGHGIHLRQFARAFVIEDEENNRRIVFVSVDAGMMGHGVRKEVRDINPYTYYVINNNF